jgi:hypothetical protein
MHAAVAEAEGRVSLVDAAFELGRDYHATLRAVLRRELRGARNPVNGRWSVERSSLDAVKAQQAGRAP